MIYDNFIDFVLWKTHIILMNWSDFEINKVLSDVQKRSLYDPLIPLLGNMWPIKVKKRILHPWLGLDTKVVVPILEFRFKNMKLTSGLLNNYVDQFWPNFDTTTPIEWTSLDILHSTKCSLSKGFPLMSCSCHIWRVEIVVEFRIFVFF